AYAYQGDYEEAFVEFTRSLEINLNDVNAHYSRGLIYQLFGKNEQAMADCGNRSGRLEPDIGSLPTSGSGQDGCGFSGS
ncbi:MAG: tetratricopeptide repeat protein, partial [Thermanaerothrix sp.]|nr:tetratricopeptide repeat protein [Thermanaerothrix sp.]